MLNNIRLVKSSSTAIVLNYFDGNVVTIDGVEYAISAPPTLAPTSLTIGQFYYIYAFISGGVPALKATQSSWSTNPSTGSRVRGGSGGDSDAYVGMASIIDGGGGTPVWGEVISHFNRQNLVKSVVVAPTASAIGSTLVELDSSKRITFLTHGDETVTATFKGASSANAQQATRTGIGFDGGTDSHPLGAVNLSAGSIVPVSGSITKQLSDGLHTVTVLGQVDGGATIGYSLDFTLSYRG